MKIIIFNLLFVNLILTSCSPPSSFNEDEVQVKENKAPIKKDSPLIKKEAPSNRKASCYEGCNFYYRSFKALKQVKTNSLSLNMSQIESFHNQCKSHCSQILGGEVIINNTPSVDVDKQLKKRIEEKKEKEKKSSLTPFEEL